MFSVALVLLARNLPIPRAERQLTHWSGLDGKPFYYPGNFDKRCILVATQSDNVNGFM